jgi:polyhydroxyalkanoate synthesis regulator phasin
MIPHRHFPCAYVHTAVKSGISHESSRSSILIVSLYIGVFVPLLLGRTAPGPWKALASPNKTERSQKMIDLIKKTLTTGLGLAFLTKEKIEDLSKDFVEKGKMSEKDAKEFIDELSKRSKEAKERVEGEIEKIVTRTLKKMNLVTREDFRALEKKLNRLTKAVKEMESKG